MASEMTEQAIETLKERVKGIEGGFDGRAILLFSGGRDSSAVAGAFCQAFPQSELHLLLVDNGLLSRTESTKRQATIIKTLFPDTEVHFIMKRVSQMMRQVGMQNVEKDFTERGYHTLLVCVACKLIMNYTAATYAHELGIRLILDGYAQRQSDYPEQTDECMKVIRQMFAEAGLVYLSPLYDVLTDKKKVNRIVAELGIHIDKQEPVCMWADSFSTASDEDIARYAGEKLQLIRDLDPILHA